MSSALVFEDAFEVGAVDPDGKKFDKVSRIVCRSDLYEMDLTLDVNTDVYPLAVGDKFSLALAPTLALDGAPTGSSYGAALQGGAPTLADNYDYVCHGKVFKLAGGGGGAPRGGGPRAEVFASFGGLLMRLAGDAAKLGALGVGSTVFLMVRKV